MECAKGVRLNLNDALVIQRKGLEIIQKAENRRFQYQIRHISYRTQLLKMARTDAGASADRNTSIWFDRSRKVSESYINYADEYNNTGNKVVSLTNAPSEA